VGAAAKCAVWEVEANMVQKKAGTGVKAKARTGVKNKALYKRLRSLGVSAKESARVANSSAKTSRKRASGAVSSFANLKVPELRRRAKKAGIKGRSTMNKKQLIRALRTA
jgi:Rho termination factor, N-terminal domain